MSNEQDDECFGMVRYPDGVYEVGRVKVSPTGNIMAFEPTGSGDHRSYPPDGRIHDTDPTSPSSERHQFLDEVGPATSNVTLYPFERFEVSSTGPPPSARRRSDVPDESLVVPAPSSGTGAFFAAAVGSDYVDEVEADLQHLTSRSTYRIGEANDQTFLLGWDPDGTVRST